MVSFPQQVRRIKNTVGRVRKHKKDSISWLSRIPNLVGDKKNVKLVDYTASFLEVLSQCHSLSSSLEREEVHTDKSGTVIELPNCGVKHLNLDLIFKNLHSCVCAVYSSQLFLSPLSHFLFFSLITTTSILWSQYP